MPNFPDRISDALDPMRTARAAGLERRAESDVHRYATRAWKISQFERIDRETLGDALRDAFDDEVEFYDDGVAKAEGSLTKQELLTRKLQRFSRGNDRRIDRKFV
jgi:hypothetical protein